MAYQPTYETDDSAVPAAVRIFFMRRLSELAGVLLFLALIAAGLSLASWSVDDPSLNHALDRAASNWLGYPGAVIADELMQFFGLGVLVLLAVPVRWAVGFLSHDGMQRPFTKLFSWLGVACRQRCPVRPAGALRLVAGLGPRRQCGRRAAEPRHDDPGPGSFRYRRQAGGRASDGRRISLPGASRPGHHGARRRWTRPPPHRGHGRQAGARFIGRPQRLPRLAPQAFGRAGASCAGPRPSSTRMAARMTSSAALPRSMMAAAGAAAVIRHPPASSRSSRPRRAGRPRLPKSRMNRSRTRDLEDPDFEDRLRSRTG